MTRVEVDPGCPNCGNGLAAIRGGPTAIEFTCTFCGTQYDARALPLPEPLGPCDLCEHAAGVDTIDGHAVCAGCAEMVPA